MENLRRAVKQIAYTPQSQWLSNLSALELSLIPLLSLASSLYSVAVRLRRQLYGFNILHTHRLPLPVISVGNLTWGGNGKTPMVELLSRSFAEDGISPLILTRGYGGADEGKMLHRQLQGTSAKIGVGTNRVATAVRFINQYGSTSSRATFEKLFCEEKTEILSSSDPIGVAILDDGMQVQEKDIDALNSTIRKTNKSAPIFFTKMTPIYFFPCRELSTKLSTRAVENAIVLCLSGIGHADSFIQRVKRMGSTFVDHLDFSDHHLFDLQDLEMVRTRLEELESKFGAKPVVVVTEKDYDRAPEVVEGLKEYEVLVLCSRLQFVEFKGNTQDRFRKTVRQYLRQRWGV